MKRIAAIFCLAAILLCGCGEKEETTVTGIVTAVEGTQITLMTFSGDATQRQEGEAPTMPEGFDGQMPNFQGGEMPTMPEGETMPDFQGGEMPNMPEGFDGQMPNFQEGEMPTMPEGETRPQRGDRTEGFGGNRETTTVDLKDAHITVEFDGGKATGSMEDIKQGVSVTVTLVDGKATNAVVSESSGFGGGMWQGMFGGNRPDKNNIPGSTEPENNA